MPHSINGARIKATQDFHDTIVIAHIAQCSGEENQLLHQGDTRLELLSSDDGSLHPVTELVEPIDDGHNYNG